jgi:ATP-binding cassette subfamily B protein
MDGIDIRDFASAALRREISVVFQDFARYQLTAQENIWLGNVDTPMDRERIEAAARHTGADAVIRNLRQGYETQLGRQFANGSELSIGEWQKIALTRAFLRESQILVMDEPTSALDAWAEFQVYQHFHQLARGRTAILISHRLSAMRMIDRIFVLEGGRIAECGGHDELLGRGGVYARLFEIQARQYR